MEIKTCEQYVLDKLQQAETRIAELEIENAHLTDKLLDLTRTAAQQKKAEPAAELKGDLMSVTECAELFADFLGDHCCCNYNDISFDTRICWLDCDQAEDNGCQNGLGCWKRYVRTALDDLRGETELPDDPEASDTKDKPRYEDDPTVWTAEEFRKRLRPPRDWLRQASRANGLTGLTDSDALDGRAGGAEGGEKECKPHTPDAPDTSGTLDTGYKLWHDRHLSGDADIQPNYNDDDEAYQIIMENEYNAALDKLNAAISAIDGWRCNGEFGGGDKEDDQDDARC